MSEMYGLVDFEAAFVFGGPSESLSHHIAKCTWTKVQDVRPCGRIFRNISERTSEMFRTPAPVVTGIRGRAVPSVELGIAHVIPFLLGHSSWAKLEASGFYVEPSQAGDGTRGMCLISPCQSTRNRAIAAVSIISSRPGSPSMICSFQAP
ncbi:hypothetical protein PGT21_019795 [Puccinia graminis f. sp. tritici]|uniref:Uncharacterized protein n=1 Tax=Puccinia graminis f. sp. tritici TaxID=56615 RepID=A0A5B0NS44_PUCGR|nr:hypothetical protein PGT21_019795 [Puccinia graminis f. sp. tritici]